MKTNNLYKYINLLLRIAIGVGAVLFITIRLSTNFLNNLTKIKLGEINYVLIALALVLFILNWGIEAIKWRYAIRKIEKISIIKAFKITITGITLGLLTPNRIGEIPSRALLLNTTLFKELTLKTSVASFSQLLVTLLIGLFGYILTYHHFHLNHIVLIPVLIACALILLLIYFKVNKFELLFNKFNYFKEKEFFKALSEFSIIELFNILIMSGLRYAVFFFQFWLVLKAFNISLISVDNIMLISVCFLMASFIPTILISEIGVRGSVALFVFGSISDMHIQIILASVLLWLINVALPALIGIINIKDVKLLKEN